MNKWRNPAVMIGGAILVVTAAVGGYAIIDGAGNGSCDEHSEQLAQQQAEMVERLGPDAPTYDFNFPESCFE